MSTDPSAGRSIISTLLPGLVVEEEWRDGAVVRLSIRLSSEEGDVGLPSPVARQLREMVEGRRLQPSFPFLATGTPFQQRIWSEVAKIPRGEVLSYGEVARLVGCGSSRAVGRALGANPLPIVIPCHRVVAKNGIGGFSCGVAIKRVLLELEGVIL